MYLYLRDPHTNMPSDVAITQYIIYIPYHAQPQIIRTITVYIYIYELSYMN